MEPFPLSNQREMAENGPVVRDCHLHLGGIDMETITLDTNIL